MALFIQWQENSKEFDKLRYVGGGVTVADMKDVIITRKARYSNDASAEMKRRAKAYIKESFAPGDGRFNVKVVLLDE